VADQAASSSSQQQPLTAEELRSCCHAMPGSQQASRHAASLCQPGSSQQLLRPSSCRLIQPAERIKLETQFIFAICAYIPYWKRGSKTKGLAHQGSEARATLDRMQAVIDARAKPSDALVILTDANAQLAPTNDGAVGQFCVQKVANSAGNDFLLVTNQPDGRPRVRVNGWRGVRGLL
jgi:hypothetical protein